MISNIRTKCGVSVKGSDINEEVRLLQISGNFVQVMVAFDLFSEVLHSSHAQSSGCNPFCVHILIDHKKAGRVVGSKVDINDANSGLCLGYVL